LENTPPEFLILGSAARQDYSADTFCLGLSLLHLFTGKEPYEEILKEVRCPQYLVKLLQTLWITQDESNPYHLIYQVMSSLDLSDSLYKNESFVSENNCVFYDTIYRYLVLFGIPDDVPWGEANPVWHAILKALDRTYTIKEDSSSQTRARKQQQQDEINMQESSFKQYANDYQKWSIRCGSRVEMSTYVINPRVI
jgi:hypothetical protein